MQGFVIVLFAGVILTAQAVTEEQSQLIQGLRKHCIEETKVPSDLVKKARNGIFEDDAKLKEYLFCFLKNFGAIDEKGEFLKEGIKTKVGAIVGEKNLNKIVDECLVKKSSPQETAFEYTKCSYKYRPHEGYPN